MATKRKLIPISLVLIILVFFTLAVSAMLMPVDLEKVRFNHPGKFLGKETEFASSWRKPRTRKVPPGEYVFSTSTSDSFSYVSSSLKYTFRGRSVAAEESFYIEKMIFLTENDVKIGTANYRLKNGVILFSNISGDDSNFPSQGIPYGIDAEGNLVLHKTDVFRGTFKKQSGK